MAPPPTLPPPDPPYAYVVDYRPLDACSVPACRIGGRGVLGYAREIQFDGDPGAYVTAGEESVSGGDGDAEVFFGRGVVLRPGERFAFTLPESTSTSELDAYVFAAAGDRPYRARVVVEASRGGAPVVLLDQREIAGRSAPFSSKARDGNFSKYASHLRMPLPPRTGRALRVSIVNDGGDKLALSSPVVMRRVDGRGPRQALFALWDAVPFHLMRAMLGVGTGPDRSAWVAKAVAERGVYFPDGVSPGEGTGNFLVRFLPGDYWRAQGWPALLGKGQDDAVPDVVPGPVPRLAEQGFVTAFVGNNFLATPGNANVGFDGGMHVDGDGHGATMARWVARWAEDHPRDDVFLLWWFSGTHVPFGPGRDGPPAPPPPDALAPAERDVETIDAVWRNFLEGTDVLEDSLSALRRGAPDADRVVWLGADHSRASTMRMKQRAFRTPKGRFGTGLSHGCGNTSEEASVPFAVLFDSKEGRSASTPRVVARTTSTFVAWRAFEGRFGVSLDLPWTTSFVTDALPLPAGARVPWDDRVTVSAGLAGTIRAARDGWSYGLFRARLDAKPIWLLPEDQQRAMIGTPFRVGGVDAEELYDESRDPYDYANLASDRFDVLLSMRREVVDFATVHHDPPSHPRYQHVLVFPERTEIELEAARPFLVLVDGEPVPSADRRHFVVTTDRLEIVDDEEPVGVVAVRGTHGPTVLACAANGLPLDLLDEARPRWNLATARTNCPMPAAGREKARPGEVLFSFGPAPARRAPSGRPRPGAGGRSSDSDRADLLAGMKRWGYVRDIDEK